MRNADSRLETGKKQCFLWVGKTMAILTTHDWELFNFCLYPQYIYGDD
jgi:hypothetical protein